MTLSLWQHVTPYGALRLELDPQEVQGILA